MSAYQFEDLYFAGGWQRGGAAPMGVTNPWFGTKDVIDELTTQHWISIRHAPLPPLF